MAAESQLTTSVAPPDGDHTAAASPSLPLTFIENVGQFDERANFQVRSGNTTLYLADDALWATVTEPPIQPDLTSEMEALSVAGQESRRVNLKLSFVGANPHPHLEPFDRLDTRVSFFSGNDPAQWHTDVPAWSGVRYVDLYPGMDLEITGQDGRLAQRLVVRDRLPLQNVRLRVEGADNLTLEDDHLRLMTALGGFALPLLTVEGAVPNAQPAILDADPGMYEVSFPFASALVFAVNSTQIASVPDLLYSTYLGGSGDDKGVDIVVDSAGNAYVTGETSSTDFPTTTGAYDTSYNGGTNDVFVAKLSADGSTLLYSTYLGGGSHDGGAGIVVDDAGNAYITGSSWSTNFPTTDGVLDRNLSGGRDAFVAKLNAAGNELLYSTYLGGNSWDYGKCITVDDASSAYVGGFTHGSFPVTAGAAQTSFGGSGDGFAVKLSADGSTLLYSTYLGGYSWESIDGIALDDAGNAYLASHTHSTDFPTTPGAWDRTCDNCQTNVSTDAAVAKLSADGSEFIYSTLVGGADTPAGEAFQDIAVDDEGNVYVTGHSSSTDYPTTANALQPDFGGGGSDAVVTKLNANGSALLYSSYLGGSSGDKGYGIAMDVSGNVYVTGETASSDFPTHNPIQTDQGGTDAFVTRFISASGFYAYGYSTYLGGGGSDSGKGIAVDSDGYAYVTGETGSSDFPTHNPIQADQGSTDAFVAKIAYRVYLPLIMRAYPKLSQ